MWNIPLCKWYLSAISRLGSSEFFSVCLLSVLCILPLPFRNTHYLTPKPESPNPYSLTSNFHSAFQNPQLLCASSPINLFTHSPLHLLTDFISQFFVPLCLPARRSLTRRRAAFFSFHLSLYFIPNSEIHIPNLSWLSFPSVIWKLIADGYELNY